MNSANPYTHPLVITIRWIARISSLLFIGVFSLMFIGEGFEPARITLREWLSLFFFPFGMSMGMLLAWWKEGLGGAIALGSTFAGAVVGDANSAGGGNMLLCASPALLFLLAWALSKNPMLPDEEGGLRKASVSLPTTKEVLKTRASQIEAGFCPKCGTPFAASDKNCPACRINIAFARAHLDAW